MHLKLLKNIRLISISQSQNLFIVTHLAQTCNMSIALAENVGKSNCAGMIKEQI